MAEPSDDLRELRLKIVELENQFRQFIDPPELTEEELKAYKKVKAAVEFAARGCGGYPCVAAAALCGRGCYMAEAAALCGRGCYMAEAAALCGGRGCSSCYAAEAATCGRACYMAEAAALCGGRGCSCYAAAAVCGGRGCMAGYTDAFGGYADPSAMACRGCAGPCIAGPGAPGPRIGRGAVARFASLGE